LKLKYKKGDASYNKIVILVKLVSSLRETALDLRKLVPDLKKPIPI